MGWVIGRRITFTVALFDGSRWIATRPRVTAYAFAPAGVEGKFVRLTLVA